MRILVLVLMSGGQPYDSFRAVWKKYMKSHPNIDCYFYRGNPSMLTKYMLTDDTLWIRTPETYSNIFEKTILAFRYFVTTRPNTYTFLFRPNASALVDLGKYYDLCKTFPTQNFCSAEILQRGKVIEHPEIEAPSGAGYTLSFDLVNRFARTPGLRQVLIDDVTIGYYLQEWKIPIVSAPRYNFGLREYSDDELQAILAKHFHFRFRNEPCRNLDATMMNAIADRIYAKK